MKYKVIIEDVLNAYILDDEDKKIIALCGTKRPDLGFDRLIKLVEKANQMEKFEEMEEKKLLDLLIINITDLIIDNDLLKIYPNEAIKIFELIKMLNKLEK